MAILPELDSFSGRIPSFSEWLYQGAAEHRAGFTDPLYSVFLTEIDDAHARLLRDHNPKGRRAMTTISYSRPIDRPVRIQIDGASIEADWTMPMDAQGVVIFAHGSGSSRFSRQNRMVTRELYDRKFGSLLVDLLTADEEREDMLTAALRFDVNLLSERLIAAATWVKGEVDSAFLPVGFFSTGVGAAAALHAAAYRPNLVDAIVSRGGRPDLAGIALHKVKAPTLLIVGGDDVQTLALNRWAYWRLDCERKLEVIRGATHRFEERGALETATSLAMEWFDVHLSSRSASFSLPRTTSASVLHA